MTAPAGGVDGEGRAGARALWPGRLRKKRARKMKKEKVLRVVSALLPKGLGSIPSAPIFFWLHFSKSWSRTKQYSDFQYVK